MSIEASPLQVSRRTFLIASLAAGGGLMVGFSLGSPAKAASAPPTPNAFIRIDPTGRVTLTMPYVEMGQGAYTSQAQIVAEELEVDPSSLILEAAPPNEALYSSPLFLGQITGGSGSLRGQWISMRSAAAAARMMLIDAAARKWQVRISSCKAQNGRVVHPSSNRSLGYGELTEAAARLPVPRTPELKNPKDFRLVGKPMPRVDTLEKITGRAVYGIDVRPEGVRVAIVQASPVFNGKVAAVDDTVALAVPGVRQIVRLEDLVAVVADNTWAARKGLSALKVTWDEGVNAALTTADLVAAADAALERQGLIAENKGNVAQAESAAASRYEQVFRLPMLAHAAMEPLSCTVDLTAERCEIWCGSQVLGRAHKAAAQAAGLPPDKVIVHSLLLGGGFGRRLEFDYVPQAVRIAKHVRGPVKVTWSREEDFQQDYFRAHNHSRVTVGLDAAGRPVSWRHRVVAPNIMERFLPIYQKDGIDLDAVDCASGAYDIPNVLVEYTRHEPPEGLHVGNWRGVGPTRNVFIVESVIDELAHRAGRDPVEYRRSMLSNAPRLRGVLDLVAEKSTWGSSLPPGKGRGVAAFSGFGSHLALVAEVSVTGGTNVRVERVVCAVDTGLVVNPDIVRAQIEGGITMGVSAALREHVTVANGRVQPSNFDTYQLLRMHEAPKIEVHIVPSTESPGGVGEPGTSGAFAAVANAVYAATGKRVRTLPIQLALAQEARA